MRHARHICTVMICLCLERLLSFLGITVAVLLSTLYFFLWSHRRVLVSNVIQGGGLNPSRHVKGWFLVSPRATCSSEAILRLIWVELVVKHDRRQL